MNSHGERPTRNSPEPDLGVRVIVRVTDLVFDDQESDTRYQEPLDPPNGGNVYTTVKNYSDIDFYFEKKTSIDSTLSTVVKEVDTLTYESYS